jgi:CheY-like chemotaxis protein
MDGTIAVESTPGKGSTFSCTLTLAVAAKELDLVQAALEPDIVHLPEPESAHPMHILLAEDNAINQQVMVELLTDAGHKVDVACNGLEAVNMAKEIAYDAVLMDIQMPQMDGYEATRRIRASGQRHLPIIATTAHAMSGYRDECLARGMSDYIAKPIDPDQLFRTLARWSHHQPILPSVVSRVGPESSDFTEFLALEPMIDVAVMWAMLGGKPQLFRKTLQRFTESCQSAEKTLHDALEQGDMEAARRVAHTMKGVAGTMAAATLLDAASKLEEAFESTSAADWEAPLGRFFNTLNQLHQHVLIFLQPDQGGH